MATILFYSPFNQRSRDTESLMLAFKNQGHRVLSLSQGEGVLINEFLNSKGVQACSHVVRSSSGWWYYLQHIIFLIKFCWHEKVQIVYSHLEPANFVASIGQFAIRARVFICRHHIDEAKLYKFDKKISYRITYQLAKEIIVVSNHAKQYMISEEGIPSKKIIHINLAYDFKLYSNPSHLEVKEVRDQYSCDVLLTAALRLTKYKRPEIAIDTLSMLLDKGIDAKLVIMGQGDMVGLLHHKLDALNLSERVFLVGFVPNPLTYMQAADFIIHPSILDSSCVTIKEAGLLSKPVIVCDGIGDFKDYIIHGKNGFLVNPDLFAAEGSDIIMRTKDNKLYLNDLGANLKTSVSRLFDINHIIHSYSQLNEV